jgi:hypothetical protein
MLTLLKSGVWGLRDRTLKLLSRLLELLSRALELLLSKISTRPCKAELGVLRWGEARARHTPGLSRASDLPLQLPEFLALVLQADGSVNQLLECGKRIRHQMILQRTKQPIQEQLLLLVFRNLLSFIMRQLNELVSILSH